MQVVDPAATAAAESAPSKASTSLSNVWVLQFDGGGTTRACVYVGTVNAGSNILATLESGEGYSVWVVANGPADGSFTTSNPATLSDFESKLLYTGNTTSDSQIPLCGKIENVTVLKNGQLLVGNNNAVVPSVLLRRAQARVDMVLEYDVSGAVFDGAWLYNVPTGACYGLLESAADGFPEAVEDNFSYTEGLLEGATHVQGTQNANSTYTWYMGDNRRGTNSSILFEIQKHQTNAPQYATYIRIKGHEEADETKYLFHDVYLGKTKTSDFNVLRNWSYTFRVRIGGTLDQHKALASDDPRVSAGVLNIIKDASIWPEETDITWEAKEYTITIEGVWEGEIPVRVWDGAKALDEGTITYTSASKGGSTTLTVPANEEESMRSIAFQYQWGGNWVTIASGTQQERPFYINQATVSPDPTNGFSSAATAFTVTLTGAWDGAVPVRAIINGNSVALVSGSVTTSGKGVKLTVPANSYPNPARTIIFQYQWKGKWVEIDRGTQAAQEPPIDQGGGIEIAPDPGSAMTWANAITYCSSKGDGWRLPSQNELMYLWGLNPSFTGEAAFAAGDYWSATQYSSNSASAWSVVFSDGQTFSTFKTSSRLYVRCVWDKVTTPQTYPYITTATGGVVIVLRDDKGGVDEANLFSSRKTASPTGTEKSTDNRMSRKFRVQKAQGQSGTVNWETAKSYCENLDTEGYSDWRLPTQRELILIWVMGGNSNVTSGDRNDTGVGSNPAPAISSSYLYQQSGFTAFAAGYYWSATQYSSYSTVAWGVNFGSGGTNGYNKTISGYVRCVRDEW